MAAGMWGRGQWIIDPSGITFIDYPFFPATVFPTATIAWEQVDDIDLLAPSPTVRVSAELLMVSAVHRDKLAEHAGRHRIPVATRHDLVWGDILEPFLDTEFDEAEQQRTMSRLAAAGIGPEQVAQLRDRFGPAMWLYNFAVPRWEWVHLGLFDLLAATHPECSYPDDDWTWRLRARFGMPPGPFCDHEHYRTVYWDAMRIALAASPEVRLTVRGGKFAGAAAAELVADLMVLPVDRWHMSPLLPRMWELRENLTPGRGLSSRHERDYAQPEGAPPGRPHRRFMATATAPWQNLGHHAGVTGAAASGKTGRQTVAARGALVRAMPVRTERMDPRPDIQRAQAAISRGCWAEAFEALSLADRGDGLDAGCLQLLGTAAYLAGRPEEAVAALRRAAEAFAASGDARRAARAMFWLSFTLINEGEVAQGGGWLARAGHVLETAPDDCPERGLLLSAAAFRCNQAGDYAEAQRQAAHAAQIGRRSGDPDVLGLALTQQGAALLMTADVVGAMRLLDEAMVAVVSAEVSPVAAGTVYCAVIAFCHLATDLDRAREWTEALDAWCGKQPEMVVFTGQCRVHRAQLLRRHGRWQEAVEEAELACERTARPEDIAAIGAARYEQAEVCRLRGDLAAAESAYRQAGRYGCPPDPGLALLRMAQGNTAAAYEAVRRAAVEAAGTPRRTQLLPALADIAVAAGDLAAARQAAGELTAAAEHAGTAALLACAESVHAAVALAEGHAARALSAGRSAIERWRGLRMPYETARAHIVVGLACRAAGDEDGCALELDAARHLLAGLGAGPDLARLSVLDRPAAAPGVLTERELQVLRLIAAGRTNHAIGSELGLAEKTVERHVSNVLTKLGVPSRAAATAYGYEHKLL